MKISALWLICFSLCFSPSLSCITCFYLDRITTLCEGYRTNTKLKDVKRCSDIMNSTFHGNNAVIEAGKVGAGLDTELKDILDKELTNIETEFGKNEYDDTVYRTRIQTAAGNFIKAANNVSRKSPCVEPCGFQIKGQEYNCIKCKYDTCGYSLDCPTEEIKAMERSRNKMLCRVKFDLPDNIERIWRFAKEVKTQQQEQFEEVTAGVDEVYFITLTRLYHQGTYQCEILSNQRTVVRLYYYLTVTPLEEKGNTELQEMFDLSLLPGVHLLPDPPHSSPAPSAELVVACFIGLMLMLFISLGTLCWLTLSKRHEDEDEAEDDEFQ